jgi:ATP-dependent Lhr-like helicase
LRGVVLVGEQNAAQRRNGEHAQRDVNRGEEDTERALARTTVLLDRYGIVSREAASAEALPGGFGAVARVLRAMEEAGKVRRGYFVEGLSGAQYAHPGAVDRLRDRRRDRGTLLALAATDPANPWGALHSWPETGGDAASRPGRRVGATVISIAGEPVLVLEAGWRKLTTFRPASDAGLSDAISALSHIMERTRRRSLRIETIDGEPARSSRHAGALQRAGFRSEYRGLVLER